MTARRPPPGPPQYVYRCTRESFTFFVTAAGELLTVRSERDLNRILNRYCRDNERAAEEFVEILFNNFYQATYRWYYEYAPWRPIRSEIAQHRTPPRSYRTSHSH